jgi:hypothetical protein
MSKPTLMTPIILCMYELNLDGRILDNNMYEADNSDIPPKLLQ